MSGDDPTCAGGAFPQWIAGVGFEARPLDGLQNREQRGRVGDESGIGFMSKQLKDAVCVLPCIVRAFVVDGELRELVLEAGQEPWMATHFRRRNKILEPGTGSLRRPAGPRCVHSTCRCLKIISAER